jgi:hypothetical protein
MKQDNQISVLNKFIQSITGDLESRAPKFTGALANSFQADYEVSTDGFAIGIDGNSYGAFIDKGVNGLDNNYGSPYTFKGYPNIKAITPYADAIGISPYALANSMYHKGIKPRGFMTDYIDDDATELGDKIIEALWEDFYDDNKEPDKK